MTAQDTRRRFEQWARNPRCTANALSAIVNLPMRKVAEAEGAKAPFGQSPFALVRGRKFEQGIFEKQGRMLHDALIACDVLPKGASGLADFRMKASGGPMSSLDEALRASSAWLQRVANGEASETVAAGLTIRIPGGVMLPEATLCIDALAVQRADDAVTLMVAEIKVYPDRGGHTDPVQLSTSRAQAGMYAHGLSICLAAHSLADRMQVSDRGILVLSKAGSNRIRVRHNEDLRAQIQRARDGLAQLSKVAEAQQPDPSRSLEVIQRAETAYCEACVAFCERAAICRRRAAELERPEVLGDAVRRVMGNLTLSRLRELVEGSSLPASEHEREVLALMRDLKEYDHG